MKYRIFSVVVGWIFFMVVLTLGIMNLILVHPVPGVVYVLLSLVFLPPFQSFIQTRLNFSIPIAVRIILGIIIVWFTLGMSDLAEMYGL